VRGTVVVSSGTNLAAHAPPGAFEAIADRYEAALDAMFGAGVAPVTRRDRPEVAATIAASYRVPANITRAAFLACSRDPGGVFRWDITDRLAELRGPILVLAGADDGSMPPELTRRLAAGIPGARFELVPDVGHFLPMEQPARFNAILREFLAGLAQ
jgi:3-oxoadipate enol-lactonase